MIDALAREVVEWCRSLATCSEQPSGTTRTFLSAPMRVVHERLTGWMQELGMDVGVDAAGNLRGVHAAVGRTAAPHLLVGSHLDTVPDAGAFDGILGVVLGVALIALLKGRRFPFAIEIIGFSEEEGVRFGVPFIGSRALVGDLDATLLARRDARGVSVADAITQFGLDVAQVGDARSTVQSIGFVEFHIEQGPVLESLNLPLGIVTAIAGQSRLTVTFRGAAAHAGTTPMALRRDALAGAAEWIVDVERDAAVQPGLVATVARLQVEPGATNVIAGECRASLDVRHASDDARAAAVDRLLNAAHEVGTRRRLEVDVARTLDQPSVPMNEALRSALERSVRDCGLPVHRMGCGAGHDAMILAGRMPAAMLLLRTPGGISHNPAENVSEDDVAAALRVGCRLLDTLERSFR
jgi:allantoate deiminase